MATVAQILKSKRDQTVYTTTPDTKVLEAVKLMAEKHIGGLIVVSGEIIVGIVTERDFAWKIAPQNLACGERLVREIMSSPVLYVRPDQTAEECMALITENRVRHLPVLEEGKLVGMISIGDLVKEIISKQQFIIEQLQHYIQGDLG